MANENRENEALGLVRRGWSELQLQRPLAAWACWRQALLENEGDPAATQALEVLENAADLPRAARETYRLRSPKGEERRQAWDERLRGADPGQLEAAAEAFADLFDADPSDAEARYNQALGLAWQGRNAEAVRALDDVVHLQALSDFEAASKAWTLAEILRQGAGAEALADDISEGLTVSWTESDGDPIRLAAPGLVREAASPVEPAEGSAPDRAVRVFEWLDRPMPDAKRGEALSVFDVPRVFASMILAGGTLRLFSPRRGAGEAVEEALRASGLDLRGRSVDPETTPLALRLLDADALAFRLPEGLEDSTRHRLSRESIEYYYEHIWLKTLRCGLALDRDGPSWDEPPVGLSVVEASRRGREGDAVARAKLEAVVSVREQLSKRPRVAVLYGGYPFDRLRRRLGLETAGSGASAPEDVSAMSAEELERVDPGSLDDSTLLDAFRSAVGLLERGPTARILGELLERAPLGLRREDRLTAFLVPALDLEGRDPARALERLDGLAARHGIQPLFGLWKARLLVWLGRAEAALDAYRGYLEQNPEDAAAAVEAARTLALEDPRTVRELAEQGRERARKVGDAVSEWNAERFLDRFDRSGVGR